MRSCPRMLACLAAGLAWGAACCLAGGPRQWSEHDLAVLNALNDGIHATVPPERLPPERATHDDSEQVRHAEMEPPVADASEAGPIMFQPSSDDDSLAADSEDDDPPSAGWATARDSDDTLGSVATEEAAVPASRRSATPREPKRFEPADRDQWVPATRSRPHSRPIPRAKKERQFAQAAPSDRVVTVSTWSNEKPRATTSKRRWNPLRDDGTRSKSGRTRSAMGNPLRGS